MQSFKSFLSDLLRKDVQREKPIGKQGKTQTLLFNHYEKIGIEEKAGR